MGRKVSKLQQCLNIYKVKTWKQNKQIKIFKEDLCSKTKIEIVENFLR